MHSIQASQSDPIFFQRSAQDRTIAFKTARWIHETTAKGLLYKIGVYALLFFASLPLIISLVGIPYVFNVYQEYRKQRSEELSSETQFNTESSVEDDAQEKIPPFDNDQMIEKIKSFVSQKKIHLVIGIPFDKPLPKNANNQMWISMNTDCPSAPLSDNQFHLLLNEHFYNKSLKLQNVFSTITIYPLKFKEFLNNVGLPLEVLHFLLVKDENSSLIYEPDYLFEERKGKFTYNPDGTEAKGPDNYEGLFSSMYMYQINFLKKHFNSADLYVDHMPIMTEPSNSWIRTHFIVAKGPKELRG